MSWLTNVSGRNVNYTLGVLKWGIHGFPYNSVCDDAFFFMIF